MAASATASPSDLHAMAAQKQLVEPSHILFGSDFPFAPAPMTANQVAALDKLYVWTEKEKAGICRGNALALFPASI
ncbi:amidohydrolase family protein [Sinorhizobium fredii]|uniref:amidohydrolase family protein n=1 Tax=Rhizobium fredii TaxID=380 RepID=UPI00244DE43B|nr:amidohydrolase family protein [Sinorhizobium fredii]